MNVNRRRGAWLASGLSLLLLLASYGSAVDQSDRDLASSGAPVPASVGAAATESPSTAEASEAQAPAEAAAGAVSESEEGILTGMTARLG